MSADIKTHPWLLDVPTDWRITRLKTTVAFSQNGLWGDDPDGVNDIACVRVADFDRLRRRVLLEAPTMRSIPGAKIGRRLLKRGDLLIEKSGGGEQQPVGTVVQYDHDTRAVCSNFVARVEPSPGFSTAFLCYLHEALYELRVPHRSIKQTTGIQNLDAESYFNEPVPVPPGASQLRIATFLDRKTAAIDGVIAKKECLIHVLQEKRQAIITQAVTKGLDPNVTMKDSGSPLLGKIPAHWSIKRLKHIVARIVDCPHSTPEYEPDGPALVVRTADIDWGRLRIHQMRRCSLSTHAERSERMTLRAGDVMYSREGERFGMAAIVPEGHLLCLGQRMMAFRPGRLTESRFLTWALNSSVAYIQVTQDTVGATSPRVNIPTVANMLLARPQLDEQREIACFIENATSYIDQLCDTTQRSIDRLREYRQALITAAVTGKVEITNPAEAA